MRLSITCWTLLVLLVLGVVGRSWAGGGPENVLLVVNSHSDASKEIANHYIRLRGISPRNVLYLDWRGSTTRVTGTEFRDQILQPILETVDRRKIAAQLEYVIYSCDFPYIIDFRGEFKDEKLPKQFVPVASLTGATYLWAYAKQMQPGMVMSSVNWYCPPAARKNQNKCRECSQVATRGFRPRTYWTADGGKSKEPTGGQSYLLSTMLGVTVERGNTVEEIRSYLTRAKTADATQPDGTFYFMKTTGVRSSTRHDCYQAVADKLLAEGAQAVVENGKTPQTATNAVGIMAGAANLSLDTASVSIAPGAICDHFTSFAGRFNAPSQSKLSVWLRAGAAGSSGTVFEPFAIQAKFPLPVMHLHYYRGTSLAEAFYQSIPGPYQLLIVGDALCQPWATPPQVEIEGIEPGQSVAGTVPVRAKVTAHPGTEVKLCELYIDGRLLARFPPVLPIPLNTSSMGAGWHELRLVAVTSDSIGCRGGATVPFYVTPSDSTQQSESKPSENLESRIRLVASPAPIVPPGSRIKLTVSGGKDSAGFAILQNSRRVGFVAGSTGEVELDPLALGRGPVALVAQESSSENEPLKAAEQGSRSAPLWLLIR